MIIQNCVIHNDKIANKVFLIGALYRLILQCNILKKKIFKYTGKNFRLA